MAATARKRTKPAGKTGPAKRSSATAESLAEKQRQISVSEFFAKNRHLLGFDNPRKALLTTVKEAVDNALDACEEAGVLPVIQVTIQHLPDVDENRYRVTVEDNGPGVVRKQIDNIFGKLLYGSKFHRLKMSRGQQGIGISAAGMYGLMTTGKPMVIVTRPKKNKPAHHVELSMDTTKNAPEVSLDVETDDFPEHTGTRVAIELEGRYQRGRASVDAYIEQTAIANPHARFVYTPPSAESADDAEQQRLGDDAEVQTEAPLEHTTKVGDATVFPATVSELPDEPAEIKPHPVGVELGTLMRMLKQTEQKQLGGFLTNEFCRISGKTSQNIAEAASLTTRTWVSKLGAKESEALHKSMRSAKLMGPPLNCLAPIGAKHILAGLLKGVRAEFYTAATRPPAVYRGNPFQIEAGIAFGGDLPKEDTARVIRFANRVPLLYQQSACSAFKAVVEAGWRNYGLTQPRGALPQAPLVVMIHMASVWVPFTSESKEAIADYDEIRKEMTLALRECGRKLSSYLRKRERIRREGQRRDVFARYIGEVARALGSISDDVDPHQVLEDLRAVAVRRTEEADKVLDDEGRAHKNKPAPEDENVIVVPDAALDTDDDVHDGEPAGATPTKKPTAKSKPGSKTRSKKKKRVAKAPPPAPSAAPSDDPSLFA